MKKLAVLLVTLVTTYGFAQESKSKTTEPREKQTLEQRVELQTKKLTLDLDLNEKQQKEVKALLTQQGKEMEITRENLKEKKDNQKLSTQEKFDLKNKNLDRQIAVKASMKKILTPEQFTKWENQKMNKRSHLADKESFKKRNDNHKK